MSEKDITEIRRDNLRNEAQRLGGPARLADATGRSLSQISQLIGDNPTGNIGNRLARDFETVLKKPRGWLDNLHPASPGPAKVIGGVLEEGPDIGPISVINIVGTTEGGPGGYHADLVYVPSASHEYVEFAAKYPDAYSLRVVGNSMSPWVDEGEALVVYPSQGVHPGDHVVVRCRNGETMVKKLAWLRDGEAGLVSVADSYGVIVKRLEDMELMHYVAARVPRGSIKKKVL